MLSFARAMPGGGRWLLGLVLALELAAFVPALVQNGVIRAPETKASDGTSQVYPWRILWRDEILAGRPPLWNPFVFAGTPSFAEPQVQTFYPVNLVWLVAEPELAQKLTLLLHVLLASSLMFGLARTAGASPTGAAVAALAFGCQAQMASFVLTGWQQMVAPAAWSPGVLWALIAAMRGIHPRRAIAAGGMALGLQILSGHPEWVRYTLLAGGLIVLLDRAHGSFGRRVRRAVAVLAIGTLIGAPQLLPTIEAAAHSSRGQQAISDGPDLHGAGYPVLTLPTILAPRVFGPWDLHVSADGLIHKAQGARVSAGESILYIGLLPLALAVIAIARRTAGWLPWAAIAATGFLFALNDLTHLQCLFDRIVPPDAVFRSPARFVFMTGLGLSVLAALGITSVEREGLNRRRALASGATVVFVLLAVAAVVLLFRDAIVHSVLARVPIPQALLDRAAGGMDPAAFGAWAINQASVQIVTAACLALIAMLALRRFGSRPTAAASLLVIAAVAVDLGLTGKPYLSSVVDTERLFASDLAVLAPLRRQPGSRFEAEAGALRNGPGVAMLARVRSLSGYDTFHLREHDRIERRAASRDPLTLGALGVTHLVQTRGGQPALMPVPAARGRAWWTPDGGGDLIAAASAAGGSVTIDVDEPGRMLARVLAPAAGRLVLTEVFYPGWRAQVNGRDVAVERAFEMFQSVPVPAGDSRIVMTFAPLSLKLGLFACVLGLIASIIAAWRRESSF